MILWFSNLLQFSRNLLWHCYRNTCQMPKRYEHLNTLPRESGNCDCEIMWPVQRQALTWTSVELVSVGSLVTYFCKICISIREFSFMQIHLKKSPAKMPGMLNLSWKMGRGLGLGEGVGEGVCVGCVCVWVCVCVCVGGGGAMLPRWF